MLNNNSWLEQAPKMRLIILSGFLTDRNIGISLASLASPPQEIQGVKQWSKLGQATTQERGLTMLQPPKSPNIEL
ncbi:hypothetical protein IG631_03967 [Alternaria alternata]|nr:hypothetical protein IG631_03967 [Alternaria alternata]